MRNQVGVRTTPGAAAWAALREAKQDGSGGTPLAGGWGHFSVTPGALAGIQVDGFHPAQQG